MATVNVQAPSKPSIKRGANTSSYVDVSAVNRQSCRDDQVPSSIIDTAANIETNIATAPISCVPSRNIDVSGWRIRSSAGKH